MERRRDPVVVGISGASGSVLARRAIEALLERDVPVIVTCSSAARLVWQEEVEEPFGTAVARWRESPHFTFHPIGDLKAPIASGSTPISGMVVMPCSTGTLAAIAHGLSSNLLQRAADVCLKERRRLVLVCRETPLSPVHLENMLSLARLGVTILPPEPAFYLRPNSMEDVVEYIVAKALDALGFPGLMDQGLRYERRSE